MLFPFQSSNHKDSETQATFYTSILPYKSEESLENRTSHTISECDFRDKEHIAYMEA